MGTAFTYQGELLQGGVAVDEPVAGCASQFSLWGGDNDPDPGVQIGPTLIFDGGASNEPPVLVAAGRFTATLDFGDDTFTGQARWLEIAVCCPAPRPFFWDHHELLVTSYQK